MTQLTQYTLVAVGNDGVTATFVVNGGTFLDVTRAGVGVVDGTIVPSQGFGDPSFVAFGLRGVLAASELRAVALEPTGTETGRFWGRQEGAGGTPSALADFGWDLASGRLGGSIGRVIAMGRIRGERPAPSWAWSAGRIDEAAGIIAAAPGDYALSLLPDAGQPPSACVVLAQPAVTQAAGQLRAVAVDHGPFGLVKRFTALQENPGGSVLTDYDLDVVILAPGAGPGCGCAHASAFMVPGAPPADIVDPVSTNGAFDPARTVQHGVGDVEYFFQPGQGVAADESCVTFGSAVDPGPLPALLSFGYTRPSEESVRVQCGIETGGGGQLSSMLADVPYQINVWRRLDTTPANR